MRIHIYIAYLLLGGASIFAQSGTLVDDELNHNAVTTVLSDITGRVVSESRTYFDELGKGIQSQSWDVKTKKIWRSQTLYDEQGRAALSTSLAPSGNNFGYSSYFIFNTSGSVFNTEDLGTLTSDPSPVMNTASTLGAYYSEANPEKYQDVTDRPYTRTFYDELNPGKVLKVVGGNKIDTDGDGTPDAYPQGFSHTMAAAQELYYAFGSSEFANITNNFSSIDAKLTKTVAIDPHGVEVVSFNTVEGQNLAFARSGEGPQKEVMSLIGEQGFVDIHLPKGCEGSLSFIGNTSDYKVFDLKTSEQIGVSNNLPPGIYRIEAIDKTNLSNVTWYSTYHQAFQPILSSSAKGVTYNINYYDYSLNYYNQAGNLISTLPPVGFDNDTYATYKTGSVSHINDSLKSYFKYDGSGNLIYTQSLDQGFTHFKYRSDGQIRFSQNWKQLGANEFSYMNYDSRGRAIESGVYTNVNESLFSGEINSPLDAILNDVYTYEEYTTDQDGYLQNRYCKEQQFTLYSVADRTGLAVAFGTDPRGENYINQTFVEGNVSKSYTKNPETSTSWYSYDIYGRVTWMVQKIEGLANVKTIDYEYDDITGAVTKVYYQKNQADEFIHRYTYDPDDNRLTQVETATSDAGPYTVHADYTYYEKGGLKRMVLAEGLQGIDYVYNLNGSLKAINHPSLEAAKDPGGDADDVFGMMIDYYKGDYRRTGNEMTTSNLGADQYNGNIKAVHWNNKAIDATVNAEKSYTYQYNRNNWLTGATYGFDNEAITAVLIKKDAVITSNLTASEEIFLNPDIDIRGTDELISLSISDASESEIDDYQVSGITYDANGNIQSLKRNKNTANGSNRMDDLTYHYKESKPNQLSSVEDAVTNTTNTDDIKTQDLENYRYNEIGQLVENTNEQVQYVYNAAGLVIEVKSKGNTAIKFYYNDRGQRVEKESYNPDTGALIYSDIYVRDVTGTPMAIYRNGNIPEHTVYGAGRLGVYNRSSNNTTYELTDHLGNVRATIKKPDQDQNPTITGTDYYPFGMAMPLRNSLSDYRYAYQGQEKDPETGKEAFELRLWDGRIGRWLTTDPAGQYASPYLGMGNNPISRVDPDGGQDYVPSSSEFLHDGSVIRGTSSTSSGLGGSISAPDIPYHSEVVVTGNLNNNSYFDFYMDKLEFHVNGVNDIVLGGILSGARNDYNKNHKKYRAIYNKKYKGAKKKGWHKGMETPGEHHAKLKKYYAVSKHSGSSKLIKGVGFIALPLTINTVRNDIKDGSINASSALDVGFLVVGTGLAIMSAPVGAAFGVGILAYGIVDYGTGILTGTSVSDRLDSIIPEYKF